MTLIERLHNPAWTADGGIMDGKPARLNAERTRADMEEAADKIKRLTAALDRIAFYDDFLNKEAAIWMQNEARAALKE